MYIKDNKRSIEPNLYNFYIRIRINDGVNPSLDDAVRMTFQYGRVYLGCFDFDDECRKS